MILMRLPRQVDRERRKPVPPPRARFAGQKTTRGFPVADSYTGLLVRAGRRKRP